VKNLTHILCLRGSASSSPELVGPGDGGVPIGARRLSSMVNSARNSFSFVAPPYG
jgi:hypothetical protein